MSIESHETLNGQVELYRLLGEGRAAVKAGKKRPYQEVMKEIKKAFSMAKYRVSLS